MIIGDGDLGVMKFVALELHIAITALQFWKPTGVQKIDNLQIDITFCYRSSDHFMDSCSGIGYPG